MAQTVVMLLSVPVVLAAMAFGWRPGGDRQVGSEPTGLTPGEATQVALMKFTAWLRDPATPVRDQVERLAQQLLSLDLSEVAEQSLERVLAQVDEVDPELVGARRRAAGLALVVWSRASKDASGPRALELGRACLALGLAEATDDLPDAWDTPVVQDEPYLA